MYEIYSKRINKFNAFAKSEYQASADKLIEIIKNRQDPYNTLNEYVHYLKYNHNLSPLSLKQEVVTVKNLLEYSDIEISPRKFKRCRTRVAKRLASCTPQPPHGFSPA
jgi:hypothetical protein